ncbi:MAG: hypothetical protein KKD25_01980 [Gammaproteobacteria bacterium]|nr:hypothetical protein [Gammaproteobacteria bacterium]MBU0771815.1 hypothetical protein [Gammaproteobacteria bacterium]MBU0855571.1 hypothetical protein [Gammaproteobacteria bacterium]MBU1846133.1 hypothetical protein [Gammaproteobacteria bacterium]
MNAPGFPVGVVRKLTFAREIVQQFFGAEVAAIEPMLTIQVARLIAEHERSCDGVDSNARLCESVSEVARSLDAIQEEVSALSVVIGGLSL